MVQHIAIALKCGNIYGPESHLNHSTAPFPHIPNSLYNFVVDAGCDLGMT